MFPSSSNAVPRLQLGMHSGTSQVSAQEPGPTAIAGSRKITISLYVRHEGKDRELKDFEMQSMEDLYHGARKLYEIPDGQEFEILAAGKYARDYTIDSFAARVSDMTNVKLLIRPVRKD